MLDSHVEHTADIRVQELRFAAGDAVLAGRLYHPAGPARAAVVLNGATGVPQGYYRHFARWLAAERQMACLTYDYRDFGASARMHPRRSQATMADWALADQPAARTEMQRRYAGVPLLVIGHSLGAMLMPLQDGLTDVARMIVVAGGLVHHHDHPWPYRALALAFWFGHVPPLVRALGYLPGRAVGFGADLPAGVYWQWRRWCTTPGSYLPETGSSLPQPKWQGSGIPVDLFAMADDDVVPPAAVWRLGDVFGGVPQRRVVLDPQEAGVRRIGHLGAFALANAALWPKLVPQA
ncbi:alpha/beta hydrolase family protein [Leisingera sp. McT4-56]|uniref:alpha/beta hydrolase family protein n=1 Tax=Leisingera sp. McT4-56 TaxID=2881255 RepID=UPI001CF9291F|nr:alpha/beta hydrolase [Leisingera sp. McT4-56]MCB4456655.1 alpha/beta fold hydrolase [Leisingera sp. McT4-56]